MAGARPGWQSRAGDGPGGRPAFSRATVCAWVCVCVCPCVQGRAGVWIAEKRKRAWKTHVFTVTCVPCGVLQRQEHKAGTQFVLLTPRGRKDRPSQSTNRELKCLPGGEIYILKTFFLSDFI